MSTPAQQINAKIEANNLETLRLQRRKAEVLTYQQAAQIVDSILRQRRIEREHDFYSDTEELCNR